VTSDPPNRCDVCGERHGYDTYPGDRCPVIRARRTRENRTVAVRVILAVLVLAAIGWGLVVWDQHAGPCRGTPDHPTPASCYDYQDRPDPWP
jgi:hypothetical protein